MGGRAAVLLLAALLAAAAVAPAAHAAKRQKGPTCTTARGAKAPCPTLNEVVRTRGDGSVGKDDALKAFAATIAPLPGVTPPKRGYPFIRSASGPIRWILRNWKSLTPAQRSAVQKALPTLRTPGASAAPRAKPSALTLTQVQLLAEDARSIFDKYFEPNLTMQIVVDTDAVWTKVDAGAYAEINGGCRIAFPPTFAGEDPKWIMELLMHELTHCYLFQLSPDAAELPTWAVEGAAEWAGAVMSRDSAWLGSKFVSPNIRDDWKTYFKNFTQPIQAHKYSALGYFAQFARTYGQNAAFQTITQMFKVGSADAAYKVFTNAGGAPSQELLDTLAPSGTRLKPLGTRWDTDGPSIPGPADARYNPPSVTVGAGKVDLTAAPYGRTVLGLNPSKAAETVSVENIAAESTFGLLHHESGDVSLQGEDETYFCAGKKCTCPDGRVIPPLGDDAYIGLYAHKKQAKVRIAGADLEEACDQSPTAMSVTGAFSLSVTKTGSCGVKSGEMGKKPFNALWGIGYSPSRPQGIGGVQIAVGGAGTGTYPAALNTPTEKNGSAQVTKFGEPDGRLWSPFNRDGQPEVKKFGSVTVSRITKDFASGTVSMILFAGPPEPPSKVKLQGRWYCVPFDKQLPQTP